MIYDTIHTEDLFMSKSNGPTMLLQYNSQFELTGKICLKYTPNEQLSLSFSKEA